MAFKGQEPKMHGILSKSALLAASLTLLPAMAMAAGTGDGIARQQWSFSGPFGHFDRAQLQRGYQVYKEVCASCHSLRLMKYRNLAEPGGPQFSEGQVNTLIKGVVFKDALDDNGDLKDRPALLADAFKAPFPNDVAARVANNGALPPDLSNMAYARDALAATPFYLLPVKWFTDITSGYQNGGVDYTYALLTSYHDKAPAYAADANGHLKPLAEPEAKADSLRCATVTVAEGVGEDGKPAKDECNKVGEGLYYNSVFPGAQIAMPAPLASEGQVTYTDGTKGTVDQYARDVAAFLKWTADPHMEDRKDVGLRMMIFLAGLSLLLWLAKRQVWKRLH